MTEGGYNTLIVTGERVKEFADEVIDKDKKIIKLYDYREREEELAKIYSLVLKEDKIKVKFVTDWEPPCPWLIDIAQRYKDLKFKLNYNDMDLSLNFWGSMKIENGDLILKELRFRNGDIYNGVHYCGYCSNDFVYKDFNIKNWCCENCLIDINTARDTISKHIRKMKIKKVNQSVALKRMGRNPIIDNYLMRKIFMKRLSLN